jgi:hypothetical protein
MAAHYREYQQRRPQMTDRSVRALTNIGDTASSSRVLHLVKIADKFETDADYKARPLFKNRLLNTALIIKHRLRRDEDELFKQHKAVATKILVPIDRHDLKCGGRYVFVGQQHYDSLIVDAFGDDLKIGSADRITLDAIDELPTLDPFILREHLARRDIHPAACYFDISQADMDNMMAFVRQDIAPLINLTFGKTSDHSSYAQILVNKILSSELDSDLEPLRQTLKLDRKQYSEGIFCWKGFLYYKWLVNDIFPKAIAVSQEIGAARPVGRSDSDTREQVRELQRKLGDDVFNACEYIKRSLGVYDSAFRALTEAGDPVGFRDFLLSSPQRFFDLGESLAAVQHIVSFWRYRFPEGARALLDPYEFHDLLLDFESGIPPIEPLAQAAVALQAAG